jgi:hypothetical protein
MTYEIVPGMSGFGGFGAFGGAGDLLGESCLCGPSGACTNTKLQGPAMAQLRAAMAAAGLSPSTGVWKQSETNQMNALASANGQPVSSKFLVDGGPCRALKAKLAAPPPPTGGGTTTTGGVTCASLLSQAPPIPPGTPVDAVIAVLQQLAPAGFDVRACVANSTPATTIPQPGKDILPPGTAGGSVTTVTGGGDTSGLSPLIILGLGLVAVMGVGGIAFVALSPKMRKNGSRRKMRRNGRKIVPFREKSFHTPTDLWDAGAYAGKQHVAAYRPMAKRFDSANSKIAQNKVYTALNKRVARDATAAAKRMGYDRGQAIDFKEGYWHAVTKELF